MGSVDDEVQAATPDNYAEPKDPTGRNIQTLGLSALDPSFSLRELLRSKGIDDAAYADKIARVDLKHQHPLHWSISKKSLTLCVACLAAMLAAYSAGAYSLASDPLQAKWMVGSTEYNVGITVFVCGFGFAPMILAPLSEAHGRYWVFIGAGIVFFLGTVGCAVTASYAGMLVSRFVTGSGASVFATIVGGVVGDLFAKEDRNTPMSLYSLSIMIGTGIGPLVSGVVVDSIGWRWIFYLQLITIGGTVILLFFFFEETRSNVVLKRKCKALNNLWASGSGSERDANVSPIYFEPKIREVKLDASVIWRSFAFPLKLLATESVIFWYSAWVSFAWAVLYLQFSSLGIMFKEAYSFSNAELGAVYTAVVAGSTLSTAMSIIQDPILQKLYPESMATPEGRLRAACFQSLFLPIGLFWLGWTTRPEIHWAVPAVAVMFCTMGIFSIYLAVFNYLSDAYHRYASSALAAQSLCRNLLAGIFPLFIGTMLRKLTFGGTGSLLGGLGLVLTAIPWLLSFFGAKIRARSPFAGELARQDD